MTVHEITTDVHKISHQKLISYIHNISDVITVQINKPCQKEKMRKKLRYNLYVSI